MNSVDGNPNPYAPPRSLENEPSVVRPIPGHVPSWNVNWDRLLVGINVVICVVGTVAAFVEIESIVFSGFCILAAGLLLLARELHCRRRGRPAWQLNLLLGIIGPVFAATITAIIAIRSWSPQQAEQFKVHWVVAGFAACFVALSIISFMRYSQDFRSQQHASFR